MPSIGTDRVPQVDMMLDAVRSLVLRHAGLRAGLVSDEQDLFAAGMTSFSAVQLMLALEEAFAVEFPKEMMRRESFLSVKAVADSVARLQDAGVGCIPEAEA
jgi:acyl carrier protein